MAQAPHSGKQDPYVIYPFRHTQTDRQIDTHTHIHVYTQLNPKINLVELRIFLPAVHSSGYINI